MRAPVRTKLLLLLFAIGLTGCFDYRERIVFKADLSGHIDIDYLVPVHPGSGRSVLAFLPIEFDRIQSRYSSLFFLERVEIQNYSVIYSMGDSLQFPLLARVRYRLDFGTPGELERLLPGRATVVARRRSVTIRRSFPAGRPLPENSARFPRRVLEQVRQNLEGGLMSFRVEVPEGFELSTNRGTLRGAGMDFRLPLEDTLTAAEDFNWRFQLRER